MIRLGLRLTLSGGREAAVRLILIGAAVALGAGLLLVTMAGINAVNLQNDRYAWLQSGASPSSHGEAETWWNLTADDFGSQVIGRLDVAPAGPGAPVPPGIAHLPAPGEYYASPALTALLRSTPADQLADRFPGHLAGTIGNAALPAPDSLLIIIGRTAAQMSQGPGAYKVSAIDTTPPSGCGSDSSCQVNVGIDVNGIDLIFSVVALALLFPVLIFIATATRLSAARREQRFAAMRLVGATPRQVSVVAAIESSVAAIAGTLAGFGLFFVFRAPLAAIPWTGASFFTSDVSLSLPDILLIGLGVPVASAAAALLALRRVRISPLGVTRRVTPKAPRAWRLLPLLAGIVELGYFAVFGPPGTTARQVDAYVPGFLLVMVGLLYAGPWLTMMGSRVMARCTSRPAALIAARRLGDNPRAGFRAISGLILAMFATSVAVATITTINDNRGASHFGPTAATTVMYQLEGGPSRVPATLVRNLRDIRGVTGVALAYVNPADSLNSATAGLMSCAQLDRVPALGRCAPGARVAQTVPGGIGWYEGPSGNQAQRVWPPAAVAPADLAKMSAEGIFVATDGTAAAIERAQTVLGNAYPYDGQAPTLAVWGSDNTLIKWRQLADVVIFVSIPIAGCTLAASVAGGLTDRKRPFSMLRLTGAPLRMLQRVIALESAVPLVAVAALSIAAGFGATALFLRAQLHYSLASPGLGYAAIVLAALILALAIIAATFPLLARITGPETARNE